MEKVTIELNSRWRRLVRSPLMWVVWALQGVSITFASGSATLRSTA